MAGEEPWGSRDFERLSKLLDQLVDQVKTLEIEMAVFKVKMGAIVIGLGLATNVVLDWVRSRLTNP